MQRITLDAGEDYFPGNPAHYVLGKPDEKPTRRHAPMPDKPKLVTQETASAMLARIEREMRQRIADLTPLVEEHRQLTDALRKLERHTNRVT